MFSSVYLFRQAMQCFNCIFRPKEMEEVICSQLRFADKIQLVLRERTTCPHGEFGFEESGHTRVFTQGQDRRLNHRDELGNSTLPTSSNANPFELSPEWSPEDNSSDQESYVYLPKRLQCQAFERELSGRSLVQEERKESASRQMAKKYYQFDNFVRNGHIECVDVSRFVKNLAMLRWPKMGRFTYHNFRDNKVLWSYNPRGILFSNDKANPGRGKYLRHRKILAMVVGSLLKLTPDTEKLLLWLCCCPKGTVGESVFHFLSKGDKEVRMPEAERVAKIYHPDYNPSKDDTLGLSDEIEEMGCIGAKQVLHHIEEYEIGISESGSLLIGE